MYGTSWSVEPENNPRIRRGGMAPDESLHDVPSII